MTNDEAAPEEEPAQLPAVRPDIMTPAIADVALAKRAWDSYQELTKELLDETDYQRIGKTKFKKKSAWRKYAKAFNISCEVIREEIQRADDGYPIFARVWVRATEPSGRFQEADQECHVSEKCCPRKDGGNCEKQHKHCSMGCNGRIHFSHPGDITATAVTRAKNRAISDLIGAGEISYEEMSHGDDRPTSRPQRTPRQAPEVSGAAGGPPVEEDRTAPAPLPAVGEARNGVQDALKGSTWPEDKKRELVKRIAPQGVGANGAIVISKLSVQDCDAIVNALMEPPEGEATGEQASLAQH